MVNIPSIDRHKRLIHIRFISKLSYIFILLYSDHKSPHCTIVLYLDLKISCCSTVLNGPYSFSDPVSVLSYRAHIFVYGPRTYVRPALLPKMILWHERKSIDLCRGRIGRIIWLRQVVESIPWCPVRRKHKKDTREASFNLLKVPGILTGKAPIIWYLR